MKYQISISKHLPAVAGMRILVILFFILTMISCNTEHVPVNIYQYPAPHLTGVPPLSGNLDHSHIVMTSVINVDLNRDVARIPLFKGNYHGSRVWFVRTDVSDRVLANNLGLNFSPRLQNASGDCATCVQTVTSTDTIPGNAMVNFAGTVDFTPVRNLVPGAKGFPAASVVPGSVGGPGYSDLIEVAGSHAVYNAPIVAVGSGPLDVSQSHTNTMDRVVAIDTINMTVDLQFIRAFAFGKDIFYFSFGATDPESATIERGTYVPAMVSIPAANQDDDPSTARSDIFAFANGKLGLNDPNVQGLNHVILDNAPGEFSNDNPMLFETFRTFGDARNILGSFTTVTSLSDRLLYSPLWDLHVAKWTDSVVAQGLNYAQTDASTINQLASRGFITNPDGTPLSSANIIVNCPIIGFARTAPNVIRHLMLRRNSNFLKKSVGFIRQMKKPPGKFLWRFFINHGSIILAGIFFVIPFNKTCFIIIK